MKKRQNKYLSLEKISEKYLACIANVRYYPFWPGRVLFHDESAPAWNGAGGRRLGSM
jgi:hypothetical protein